MLALATRDTLSATDCRPHRSSVAQLLLRQPRNAPAAAMAQCCSATLSGLFAIRPCVLSSRSSRPGNGKAVHRPKARSRYVSPSEPRPMQAARCALSTHPVGLSPGTLSARWLPGLRRRRPRRARSSATLHQLCQQLDRARRGCGGRHHRTPCRAGCAECGLDRLRAPSLRPTPCADQPGARRTMRTGIPKAAAIETAFGDRDQVVPAAAGTSSSDASEQVSSHRGLVEQP